MAIRTIGPPGRVRVHQRQFPLVRLCIHEGPPKFIGRPRSAAILAWGRCRASPCWGSDTDRRGRPAEAANHDGHRGRAPWKAIRVIILRRDARGIHRGLLACLLAVTFDAPSPILYTFTAVATFSPGESLRKTQRSSGETSRQDRSSYSCDRHWKGLRRAGREAY